jgi:hypothetical protein
MKICENIQNIDKALEFCKTLLIYQEQQHCYVDDGCDGDDDQDHD